jgi:uncharacterized protein YndB with AHSA1/START domain
MDLSEMVVEVAEVVPAPPDEVFALLTDVELMAGLGPEHVGARWVGTVRGVGAAFVGVNRRQGIGTWEVRCRVVEHEPPTRFAWATGDADEPSALWSYTLRPIEGGTQVIQRFQHGPGRSYLRLSCEKRPEKAGQYVAGRAAELEGNMRSVLRAAAGQLAAKDR